MKTKIALTTILLYVIGCSSTVKPPKWYVSPPEYKKGIRYTSGTATADDLQTAFDMARLAAETDLVKELKSQLNGSMDRERNVLKILTTYFYQMEFYGSNGLKARTKLSEYQYDS